MIKALVLLVPLAYVLTLIALWNVKLQFAIYLMRWGKGNEQS